jgi:hypothetical protein
MHVGRNNPEYKYELNSIKLRATDEKKEVGVWVNKNLKLSVQPNHEKLSL